MSESPNDSPSLEDAIETEAIEWLLEREEGFTAVRAEQFAAWRFADSRHDAAFVQAEKAFGLIAEMPAVKSRLEEQLRGEKKVFPMSPFRLPVWATGIAAAVALTAASWWFVSSQATPIQQHYATTSARQQQIELVDGSIVNLNVSSDVQIALKARERHVTLTAGEAHFAVAPDTSRPFVVSAGGVSIRAVGTAFSVRLGQEGVEVLVTEGKVEVTRGVGATANTPALPAEHPLLVAGERTLITSDQARGPVQVERVSAHTLQEAVRWHSQLMTFSDMPLRDAIALFNRRNVLQVSLADPALGDRKLGGTFAADQVEAFVRLLEHDGDIVAERRSASEVVLHRAP